MMIMLLYQPGEIFPKNSSKNTLFKNKMKKNNLKILLNNRFLFIEYAHSINIIGLKTQRHTLKYLSNKFYNCFHFTNNNITIFFRVYICTIF